LADEYVEATIQVKPPNKKRRNIEEYEKMHRAFGWEKEHFLQCNLHALNAAFIPEPVKQQLIDRLLEAYRTL
jgi:adenosine deaminase